MAKNFTLKIRQLNMFKNILTFKKCFLIIKENYKLSSVKITPTLGQ